MKLLRPLLAVAMLVLATAVANAQSAPSLPFPPGTLKNLLPQLSASINGRLASNLPPTRSGSTLSALGNQPLGYLFVHATHCLWITDGVNNYFAVLPQEGGSYITVNNAIETSIMVSACAGNNLVAVNITDSATGAFNVVITYPGGAGTNVSTCTQTATATNSGP